MDVEGERRVRCPTSSLAVLGYFAAFAARPMGGKRGRNRKSQPQPKLPRFLIAVIGPIFPIGKQTHTNQDCSTPQQKCGNRIALISSRHVPRFYRHKKACRQLAGSSAWLGARSPTEYAGCLCLR